jgi:hypothetical protein
MNTETIVRTFEQTLREVQETYRHDQADQCSGARRGVFFATLNMLCAMNPPGWWKGDECLEVRRALMAAMKNSRLQRAA